MRKEVPTSKKYYNGKFKPQNPKKYIGDVKNIVYRSSWEFKYMRNLDTDPNIISWASEEFSIPYISPVDGKPHRYFPDFIIKKKDAVGKIRTCVIEIKPAGQTKKPKATKNRKKLINESATYLVNQAKWAAADIWCQRNKYEFQILTEKELGIK